MFLIHFFFSGKSWQEKVKDVLKELEDKNASLLVLSALDDIACIISFYFRYYSAFELIWNTLKGS